jgi:hypothetical protein
LYKKRTYNILRNPQIKMTMRHHKFKLKIKTNLLIQKIPLTFNFKLIIKMNSQNKNLIKL